MRNLGIVPPKAVEAPINGILQRISDLDQDKIAIIARTLGQAGVFNEVVRDQTAAMAIGERYRQIARQFDSIRDDAKAMVDQLADSRIDLVERFRNAWMKVARGDIADRFDAIKVTYIDVTNSTKDQVNRETIILDAYRDFRGALKHAEVLALEVLRTAQGKLDAAKAELAKASQAVAAFSGSEPAERARLELFRDEHLPPHPLSDRQGAIGYNTSEVIMARLLQTTNAKERVYSQAVT
ncbi:MAG: cell surface protein, partial [Rhodoplanes sp.]